MPPDLSPSRLRRGEIAAGVCGGLLLTSTVRAGRWAAGETVVVTAAVSGLTLTYLQATRRAPALPVTTAVFVTTLGAAATGILSGRLVRRRGGAGRVLAAAGLTAGGFRSLRQEDGWVPDAAHPVERVELGSEPVRPA